jgi:Ca2+/H+ antiporter
MQTPKIKIVELDVSRSVVLCAVIVAHLYILFVLQSVVGHIKLARLNYKRKDCALSVQLLDEVQAQWSANLHLKLLTLIQEVGEFMSSIEGTLKNLEMFSILKLYEGRQN